MPHPYLSYGALAVSSIPGLIGINSLFRPEATITSVQFPLPSDTESRKLSRALIRLMGARNIAVSYLMFLVWSTGNQRLLGLGLFGTIEMTIIDGLVSRSLIGGGEWNHWSMTTVLVGFAAGLLGWFS